MSESPKSGPLALYLKHLEKGELQKDATQARVIEKLEGLYQTLCFLKPAKKSFFGFRKKETHIDCPRGLFIFGDVGRGKSMLMDLFFDAVPIREKKRVHFHQFMQDVHGQIHSWRKMTRAERLKAIGSEDLGDPIPALATEIAKNARLLCFDEFQVSDVADAMILGRLYEKLFEAGVVIVSTSNRPPDDLYKGGLNRALFVPFIEMIKNDMDVTRLSGGKDYRYHRIKGLQTYYTPVNGETTEALRKVFWALTDRDVGDPATVPSDEIEVKGRKLFVPKSAMGAAVFSFKRLCVNPLGAADYLAIAWRYHTVFIVAIPKMKKENRNEAKRFVTLIDILYENNVKLFCSAQVSPEELYPGGDGSFEFSRTISRLHEMQSREYLEKGHAV
ncbi:MAG: cell division protein ZapE [Alphaproteobacteria bacterium]